MSSERLPIIIPSEIEQRAETGPLSRRRQRRHMKGTAEYIAEHAAIGRELSGVWHALADIRYAQHGYDIANDLYKNPEVVLDTERTKRSTSLKRALTDEARADTDLMRAQLEHQDFKEAHQGRFPEPEPEPKPRDPMADAMDAEIDMALPEMRIFRQEQILKTIIQNAGGEDQLTSDERELVRRIRAKIAEWRKEL